MPVQRIVGIDPSELCHDVARITALERWKFV